MIASALGSPRIYAVQNILASLVFVILLGAQGLAYLLYLHPSSELLWALNIPLHRIASPLLGIFDFGFGQGAFASMTVLAITVILPLIAWWLRNWLGTAVSGHVALAVCVILTDGALRRIGPIERTASLTPFGGIPPVDSNTVCLAAVTLAMVILCFINHAMFFRRAKQV